jgi:hypothetical protein
MVVLDFQAGQYRKYWPASFRLELAVCQFAISASGFSGFASGDLSNMHMLDMVAMCMIASGLAMLASTGRVARFVKGDGVLFVFAIANRADDGLGGLDEVAGQDKNGFVSCHLCYPLLEPFNLGVLGSVGAAFEWLFFLVSGLPFDTYILTYIRICVKCFKGKNDQYSELMKNSLSAMTA